MSFLTKGFHYTSIILFLFIFFASWGKAQAACSVVSCSPIFASDAGLNNKISSLTQSSLTNFTPANLFIAYEVSCGSQDRVTIPYCFNTADVGSCSPSIDAVNAKAVTVNGKRYFVGQVPSDSYNYYAQESSASQYRLLDLRANLWSNNFLCASNSTLPATYKSESCSITPAATRNSQGTFDVALTMTTENLIPGKGYEFIIAPQNSLDVHPAARSGSFTAKTNEPQVQQGFQDYSAEAGTYQVCIVPQNNSDVLACASAKCSSTVDLDGTVPEGPPVFPTPDINGGSNAAPFILCDQAATPADKAECQRCVGGQATIDNPETQGLWTAFGCVKTSKEGVVLSLVRIGMGLSGGFVLLSILYGAFLLTTSSGDPKRVQEGQEMISSAIMGLLFVIFSVIILQFIGVSLLQIPGFGT